MEMKKLKFKIKRKQKLNMSFRTQLQKVKSIFTFVPRMKTMRRSTFPFAIK